VRQAEFDATTTYQQEPMNSAAVRERRARRDSALFDLLTNDTDRATFRKNQAASRRSFGASQSVGGLVDGVLDSEAGT
jgi:hypothetical protein